MAGAGLDVKAIVASDAKAGLKKEKADGQTSAVHPSQWTTSMCVLWVQGIQSSGSFGHSAAPVIKAFEEYKMTGQRLLGCDKAQLQD